jgi:Calcineurin-like phosphoesterase
VPGWVDGPGRRVAVIGDVAGHLTELRNELARLGADARSGTLPPELTVVQVGDLVHRGPESDAVISLVDRYLTRQPGQWIQLVGNHEAQYLRAPVFDWPERIAPESVDTVRRWWASGQMLAAAGFTAGTESFVVTHAGVTSTFWQQAIGAPGTAEAAVLGTNALIGAHPEALFRAGQMLRGRRRNGAAGPVWVAAATELLPSWLGRPLPFSQIHGHTSLYDWQHDRFHASPDIARSTSLDEGAKHETTALTGGRIIGVDPGHGRVARQPWRAWETQLAAARPGPDAASEAG